MIELWLLNSNGHKKKEYNFIFYHQIILQSESLLASYTVSYLQVLK